MAKFHYFYQSKENKNLDGWIVAKSRDDAYAQLRKQSIKPYKVVGKDPIAWKRWAAIAVLAVALAGTYAWLALRSEPVAPDEQFVRHQIYGAESVIRNGISTEWSACGLDEGERYLARYAQPGIKVAYRRKTPETASAVEASLSRHLEVEDSELLEYRQLKQIKGMCTYVEDRSKPSLRHGGDLNGIREHMDYFKELGVTALWFTPVMENDSPDSDNGFSTYHGYATTNYYRVDPRFGSNEDYKRLCDEAHEKGLKIVMDMIFNHSGFEHPWTLDMPSKDWLNLPEWLKESNGSSNAQGTSFLQTSYKLTPVVDPYASKVDLKETTEGWFVPTMPDLNQHNPHLLRYLIQNSFWWIETVGIDGIRMDTYPYAYADAMAQWMKELNEEYPNFNTVGETWVTEPAYTATWQKDSKLTENNSHLKTVMDFSFYDKMNSAKHEETDGNFSGLQRLYNSFVYDYLYPNPSSVMAFIENHDTDRFLGNGKDTLALKQALALLLTVNRIPQLYYGTEVLMNGTKEVTDGNVRKDFPGGFPGDERNCFTKEGRTKAEQSMFTWMSRLLHWRQGNEVITKGKQTQFLPYQGVYVVARQYQGKTALTVLNGTSKPTTMNVARYEEVIGKASKAKDILTGRYVDLSKNIELKPRQSLVLEF